MFPDNSAEAFSNHHLWNSVGVFLMYYINDKACVSTKLNFLLISLFIAMIGYYASVVHERKKVITGNKNTA